MVDRGIVVGIVLMMFFPRANGYTLTYHASCFNEIQADGISQYKDDIIKVRNATPTSYSVFEIEKTSMTIFN
jgi:hypothetical protein